MNNTKRQHSKILLSLSLAFVIILALILPQKSLASMFTIYARDYSSIGAAYNMGSWNVANSYTTVFESGVSKVYYKFNAQAGDLVAVSVSVNTTPELTSGTTLRLRSSSGSFISESAAVVHSPTSTLLCFNIVREDVSANGTYYIEVEKGANLDRQTAITVGFMNRVSSANGSFSLTPATISNPGNSSLNLTGIESALASVNLTSETSIPTGAKVKSVTTSATQTPSQGSVHHGIKPGSSSAWFVSTVSSATSGAYSISLSNNINVKQQWQFRYNAMATASSTMKTIKLNITYQYDPTLAYTV